MADTKRKAVYPGSFDPPTNGHLYVIREGARLFDELVVAVGTNPDKRYSFGVGERAEILREAVSDLPNVTVAEMGNVFLVDFARSAGASHVLKGMRDEADFRLERTMRNVNADIAADVATVFVMPPREMADVSSSFVKGLVGPEGWERVVARYVPPAVVEALARLAPAAKSDARKGG
ncbi:MAG: pantetheine-phosphate adenylyltransferase [Planctomycetota bacterium]|jgi:pantetheine-phosphate adenylyltransferase